MEDQGIIERYVAKLSPRVLGSIQVLKFGWSNAPSYREVARRMGEHDAMNMMLVASGNYLYLDGMLRNSLELDEFVRFVREKAEMPGPTVGLVIPLLPVKDMEGVPRLNETDNRILDTLIDDARRPASDIADDLGISSKTVRRRINRMIEEDLVRFGMLWHPDRSTETVAQVHLQLEEGEDPRRVMFSLVKLIGPRLLFSFSFSNLPNLVIPMTWSGSNREMNDNVKRLEDEGVFRSVVQHHLIDAFYYSDWREEELRQRSGR
jgi:DNA-binding Lrp family transcriptional regulator